MENLEVYEELKNMLGEKVLNTKTMEYRLWGLMDAMDMSFDENDEIIENQIDNESIPLIANYYTKDFKSVTRKDKNNEYSVKLMVGKDKKKSIINLSGYYLDNKFEFINFYQNNLLSNQYHEVPFALRLVKSFGENSYDMFIRGEDGKTEFILNHRDSKSNAVINTLHFYTHRADMENILPLVQTFINQPDYVFHTYKMIMDSKEVIFKGEELDSVKYTHDLKVDENGKTLEKVLK